MKGKGDTNIEVKVDEALSTIRGMDQTVLMGGVSNNININTVTHKNVQIRAGHKLHSLQGLYKMSGEWETNKKNWKT